MSQPLRNQEELQPIQSTRDLQAAIRSSKSRPLLLCFHSPVCEASKQLVRQLRSMRDYSMQPLLFAVATINVDDAGMHRCDTQACPY